MSAYVVSKDHIDYLVSAAKEYTHGQPVNFYRVHDFVTHTNWSALGQLLWDENTRSVNYRYERENTATSYMFNRSPVPVTSAQVLKAISCYAYQSCEHDDWEASEAKAFTDWLTQQAHEHMAGMSDAMWEIDNATYAEKVAAKRAQIRERVA
jgi:hypothetical protein